MRDAPKDYGRQKALYSRPKRWGEKGIFLHITEGLAAAIAEPKTMMIDATYGKANCTASTPQVKRKYRPLIGCTKGGMNITLHAVSDANGRPFSLLMTAEQVSDYTRDAAERTPQSAIASRRQRL